MPLDVPETYQLTATITPSDASNKTLNWTSSNPAAATVDSNGLVTVVGNGTAVIKAESADGTGISASCTVTVIDPTNILVSGIKLNQTSVSLEAMETFQITATITPTNAANKGIVWASSNEAVASVDENGLVTAKSKGTATITATAADGNGATASCTVTVTNNGYLVTELDQFQSSHPYANSCTDFWLYRQSGAGSLSISFAAETEMEDGFDYLHIYDGNGSLIGTYTGTELANQTITIPVIGHEHRYEAVVMAPTCTEQGYTTYTCRCGESYTADYVDALGHAWGDWIVLQEPTTTEDGVEEHTCTRCGRSEQRSIAKLENPFNDVAPGSFFYEPVMWAIENGITNGTSATTFGPNDQCMRAHVVTFLWRAVGCPEPTRTDNPFVDVKPGDFYYKPVLWALENGITSGMDATHFGPTAYDSGRKGAVFMELACTKKLLEYLGVKPEKGSAEIDPLFGWTANLLVVNRRKLLVAVHGASRCAFVLYGLTAKALPKLPELIMEGVRGLLQSEYVRPEIIERYLDDLGRKVAYRANSDRKIVAGCNKVCERIKMFPELFQAGDLYQHRVLPWLNEEPLSGSGYVLAHEALITKLKERYGENVQSCRALELEVSLELHTPCKRRIAVPDDMNFDQFHDVLQHCFEWRNNHLHQFVTAVDAAGYPAEMIRPDWDGMEEWEGVQTLDSTKVMLRDVFPARKRIVYEYDFGDGWTHIIDLCRVIEDCPEPYPHCILAVGDAPMEDCGGPDGFAHVMAVLKDKKHPEYRETLEWVRSTWWKPLDVDRINAMIRNIHRRITYLWLG